MRKLFAIPITLVMLLVGCDESAMKKTLIRPWVINSFVANGRDSVYFLERNLIKFGKQDSCTLPIRGNIKKSPGSWGNRATWGVYRIKSKDVLIIKNAADPIFNDTFSITIIQRVLPEIILKSKKLKMVLD